MNNSFFLRTREQLTAAGFALSTTLPPQEDSGGWSIVIDRTPPARLRYEPSSRTVYVEKVSGGDPSKNHFWNLVWEANGDLDTLLPQAIEQLKCSV